MKHITSILFLLIKDFLACWKAGRGLQHEKESQCLLVQMGVCTHMAKEPIASPVPQWHHPRQESNSSSFSLVDCHIFIFHPTYIYKNVSTLNNGVLIVSTKDRREERAGKESAVGERAGGEGGRKERVSLTSMQEGGGGFNYAYMPPLCLEW